MRTDTQTLIAAMRILSRDIKSEDGIANAAIFEAAERMEELEATIRMMKRELVSSKLDTLVAQSNAHHSHVGICHSSEYRPDDFT